MKGVTTVWLDTETAGVEDHHATIQIACVVERDWQEIATFEQKIRFDATKADPAALALNHYDAKTWEREAVGEGAAVALLGDFLRSHAEIEKRSKAGNPYRVARLAGHNIASFDAPRLMAAFKRHGAFLPAAIFETLDTLHLSRWHALRLASQPENFKLPTLCAHFGIPNPDAHDALADVRSCIAIARAILEDGE